MPPSHTETFTYGGDPIEITPGAPYVAGLGIYDVPMFSGFDPNSAITHFKFKFWAQETASGAMPEFDVVFYNTDMNIDDPDSPYYDSPIVIQDGWASAGESWGTGLDPATMTTFVSDHEYYGTTEGDWGDPTHVGTYLAGFYGDWNNDVVNQAAGEGHLPGGGDWVMRFIVHETSPGSIMVYGFSMEVTYQEWKPRIFLPVPLTTSRS